MSYPIYDKGYKPYSLALYILVLSADDRCKQFGTRSGPTNIGPEGKITALFLRLGRGGLVTNDQYIR